jgi:hypothetical protein
MVDAVFSLSDDPCAANVERYLAASQALEDTRRPPLPMRAHPTNRREDDDRKTRDPVHR